MQLLVRTDLIREGMRSGLYIRQEDPNKPVAGLQLFGSKRQDFYITCDSSRDGYARVETCHAET